MFLSWMIAIVKLIAVFNCLSCGESSQGDSCSAVEHECSKTEHPKLVRLDGVKVGHVQSLQLSVERKHQLITRSLRPLLFEIPDFLSGEECEHIIKLAGEEGLFDSTTLDDPDDDEVPPLSENEKQVNCNQLFGSDENSDERISVKEFTMFINDTFGMPLSDADANALFHKIKFDNDEDGLINLKECRQGDHKLFDAHMYDLEKNHPQHRARLSKQTWLKVNGSTDPVINQLQERVILLTRLPRVFIENSEDLQVVYYDKYGHYHAHYDSDSGKSDPSFPCCREGVIDGRCHLCRFITVLYYLNDVPRGGETAFPVADQEYFNQTEHDAQGLTNLSTHCYDSNVIVRPKRGTAVMWYNHAINNVTGLMGPMDVRSLHGGCDVLQGHKWIANNWIHAPFTWTGIS